MASISCRIMFFRSSRVAGRLWYTQLLRYPHRKNHKESDLGFGGGALNISSSWNQFSQKKRLNDGQRVIVEPSVLGVSFKLLKSGSEKSLKHFDITLRIHCYCVIMMVLEKIKRADYSRCRHCSPNCDHRAMQRPFMFLFGVLFTPVAAILIIDMAIKVEMSLIGE